MYKFSLLDKIAFILIILGGINWGLIGLLNFNIISYIFKFIPYIERIMYILLCIAAIDMIITSLKYQQYKIKK